MTIATNTTEGQIVMSGDLDPTSTGDSPRLRASGVAPGVYNSSIGTISPEGTAPVNSPTLVVDTKGRIIYARSASTIETIAVATNSTEGVVKADGASVTITDGTISVNVGSAPTATDTVEGFVKFGGDYSIVENIPSVVGLKQSSTIANGKIRPDNSTIGITNGVLSVIPPATATSSTLGIVKPDNSSIRVSVDGTLYISAVMATSTTLGVVQPDNDSITISNGVLTSHIAKATSSTLGTVQPDNTTISILNGIISRVEPILPTATGSTLGVVKVDGTSITSSSGVLSAVYPTATNTTLGVVKPDGTSITISGGVISAISFPTATSTNIGNTRGDNSTITIVDGTLSMNSSGIPTATSADLGKLQINSTSLTSSSGVLSLRAASTAVFGAVKVSDTYFYQSGGFLKARNILISSQANVSTKAQFNTLNGTGTGAINYINNGSEALSLNSFYRGTNYWMVSTSNSAKVDGFKDTNMYGAQMTFIMSHGVGINLPSFPAVSTSYLGGFKIEGGSLSTIGDAQRLFCDMVVIKKDNKPFGLIYNQNVLS